MKKSKDFDIGENKIKRIFDLICSILGIIILSPFILLISLLIKLTSEGEVFYRQVRIGRNMKRFEIYKFRTMIKNADKIGGKITVGKDKRITALGRLLRKLKLDELPQLFNIIKGEMSLVGPRPEVPEYIDFIEENAKNIFRVRPGITDYASIYFSNEDELLDKAEDPEKFYIEKVLPYKIRLNLEYISRLSLLEDLKIIILTILKIIGFYNKEITYQELQEFTADDCLR